MRRRAALLRAIARWPGWPVTMVTVTLPAEYQQDPRAGIRQLKNGWKRVYRDLGLSGWVAFEATRRAEDRWHVHAHGLILGALFFDLSKVRAAVAARGLGTYVNVSVKPRVDPRIGAAYLTKYVTKTGADLPRSWRNVHLLATFGAAFGCRSTHERRSDP